MRAKTELQLVDRLVATQFSPLYVFVFQVVAKALFLPLFTGSDNIILELTPLRRGG